MQNRRLRRFFASEPIRKAGDTVRLTPADSGHLKRILRLQEGDACLVIDSAGHEAEAEVSGTEGVEAVLVIRKVLPPRQNSAGISVFVYPGFIQRGKMDELVRQMQELGVDGFFPIETERTVVKMSGEAKEKVAERWEKIIQEAAKQSGSLARLQCAGPRPLKDLASQIPANEIFTVFHPENNIPFSGWIKTVKPGSRVHLFIGPEGGFSEKEVAFLKERGAACVGLGETVLKADTAVLGITSALKFLYV